VGQGWIKLHRKIRDCSVIWDDKPFSRGQAWIDLLMMANHEDKDIYFDGGVYRVERGQKLTSIRKLSEEWGWSRTKTTKFQNDLKKAEMISLKSDTKKTVVTIVNYNNYQDIEIQKEPPTSHKQATEKPQKDTNKNDKELKNEKKKIYIGAYHFSDNEILQSAFNDFLEMRKAIKKPMTERAIKNLAVKLNKLSPDIYTQADILDQSINHSWQDVYPLKNDFVSSRRKTKEIIPSAEPEHELTDEEFFAMVDSNFGEG
jgi:hypothetical protein